jgi:hypothetical protein
MPTFTGSYVEPGTNIRIQDAVLPALPPGVFAAALIGTGIANKTITNEQVTFASTTVSLYESSCLAHIPLAADSDYIRSSDDTVVYQRDVDYTVNYTTGIISWAVTPPVVPLTIKVDYSLPIAAEALTGTAAPGCTVWSYAAVCHLPVAYLTETVKNAATPTTVYTRGTEYSIDYPTGVITWDVAKYGNPPNIKVDYNYRIAAEAKSIILNTASRYQGTLANTTGLLYLERDANGIEIIHGPDSATYTRDDGGSGTTTFTFFPTTGVVRLNTIPSPSTSRIFSVTYTLTKDSTLDYDPLVFSSLQSVIDWYGPATSSNTISLGAQLYFENGGGLLVAVQVHSDTYSEYTAAVDKLANVDVYCIIPLLETNYNNNTGLPAYMKTHVTNMSSTVEKKERLAILAGPIGADSKAAIETSVTNYITSIQMAPSARVVYLAPSSGKKTLSSGQLTLSGPYIAAALAGIICNPAYTSGEPISGKNIAGFDSVEDIYTRYQKNRIASYGGLIIEQTGGRMAVRHALSTDNSTIVNSEVKITKIKDYIARTMRQSLDSIFINTRNLGPVTLSSIKGVCALLLDGVISLRDIVSYQNLTVVQNSVDPRQIDVSFQIRPTWDINWILVTFGVTIQ